MKLEQPKANPEGDLAQRVRDIESYLYRLHGELMAIVKQLEAQNEQKNL